MYDLQTDCTDPKIDEQKLDKVGIGVAADKKGNKYAVRIYSTMQNLIRS